MDSAVSTWLQQQQPIVDQLIYRAANRYYREQQQAGFTNLDYDIGITTRESLQLGQGDDLCYDRPTIGYTYSLWYHARRVNTFLRYFLRELLAADPDESLDIFDLGAGTGAVQWAVGLVVAGMQATGRRVPPITVINVDSSPFMLDYNRNYLWPQFLVAYPTCAELACSFNVNSWSTPAEGSSRRAWVVSSYLFDHVENKEFLVEGFQALVKLYQPDRVLMLTSSQQAKREQLAQVAQAVKGIGYQLLPYQATEPLFTGTLPLVTQLREALRTRRQLPIPNRAVTWDEPYFSAVALHKLGQAALAFDKQTPETLRQLHLYVSPLVVRRDIKLNELQEKAAQHTDKPTVITGPAGCGKSVVITERVVNLLKKRDFDPSLRILVTSFNKELIGKHRQWLRELLPAEKVATVEDGFQIRGAVRRNVSCLHFDVIPNRLGGVDGEIGDNLWHYTRMRGVIREVTREQQLPANGSHTRYLTPEYLVEEFHRVVYGLGYFDGAAYQDTTNKRTGRGDGPSIFEADRRLIWQCLEKYLHHLQERDSFISRRYRLLQNLRAGHTIAKFDYIYVDEYQDCTPADLEIFRHLLQDPDHIVLAGDLAQAVHIGRTSAAEKRFRQFMGLRQNRETTRLQGSYRLPFRISEAIRGVSERINSMYKGDQDAGVISPYKGSPPGARPIIVYADSVPSLADRLSEVIRCYQSFDLRDVTILERDNVLARALKERLPESLVETDTILRLKGLEKTCVVWSTSVAIEHTGEVFEYIYTILTRTSCLLLITLTPETALMYRAVLQRLRIERLICWDAAAQQHLLAQQAQAVPEAALTENDEL